MVSTPPLWLSVQYFLALPASLTITPSCFNSQGYRILLRSRTSFFPEPKNSTSLDILDGMWKLGKCPHQSCLSWLEICLDSFGAASSGVW